MIRLATPDDAAAVREIYAPYVADTAVTFETEVPDEEAVADRIRATLVDYPWFVCERDGEVAGYACGGALRSKAAYRWAVETTVYVDRDRLGRSIGRALYEALLGCLGVQGYQDAYAVLSVPNPGSEAFHEAMGFAEVARFPDQGYKHGAWRDVAWWRKALGDHPADPGEPLSVADANGRDEWSDAVERDESRS